MISSGDGSCHDLLQASTEGNLDIIYDLRSDAGTVEEEYYIPKEFSSLALCEL
jgi:hypothetical protein